MLVAVLWLLAALAALAAIFSAFLANSARAIAVNDNALADRGAGVGSGRAHRLSARHRRRQARPARGSFHTRLNGADISVSFVAESARIDLNHAPKPLLAGLLTVLGATPERANDYADRIIGWRTEATPGTAGGEDALYRAAGLAYGPRLGPFAHVNELGLVLGLPPALVERALPFVTVFSGLQRDRRSQCAARR